MLALKLNLSFQSGSYLKGSTDRGNSMAKLDKSLLNRWSDLIKKILGPPIEDIARSPKDRATRAASPISPSNEALKEPKEITTAFDRLRIQNKAFVKSVLEISVDPNIDNTPKKTNKPGQSH